LEHLLRGYLSQKSLDAASVAQFPLFLKLLEIGLYSMLYRSYNPEDSYEWSGKFMPGRQQRVEADIPYVDLDFERILEKAVSVQT
jgi:amicoumacin kinase